MGHDRCKIVLWYLNIYFNVKNHMSMTSWQQEVKLQLSFAADTQVFKITDCFVINVDSKCFYDSLSWKLIKAITILINYYQYYKSQQLKTVIKVNSTFLEFKQNSKKHFKCGSTLLNFTKSGNYLSNILAILISPRPFLKLIRVVEAWARMCPPIGFLGSAWNLQQGGN